MQETQETQVWSLGWEDPLEEGMATYSSILAWRIPWTEEPDGLPSMGLQRVGHDWACILWWRLLLPGPPWQRLSPNPTPNARDVGDCFLTHSALLNFAPSASALISGPTLISDLKTNIVLSFPPSALLLKHAFPFSQLVPGLPSKPACSNTQGRAPGIPLGLAHHEESDRFEHQFSVGNENTICQLFSLFFHLPCSLQYRFNQNWTWPY